MRFVGGIGRVYRRAPGRTALLRAAAALAALLLAGCAARAAAGPQAGMVGDGLLPPPIRADAARRAGVPAAQVRLLAREAVTWPDGALGCPAPDRLYPQALVPGYRYRLQAGAQVLVYHADRRGHWLWCPADRAQPPLPDPAT